MSKQRAESVNFSGYCRAFEAIHEASRERKEKDENDIHANLFVIPERSICRILAGTADYSTVNKLFRMEHGDGSVAVNRYGIENGKVVVTGSIWLDQNGIIGDENGTSIAKVSPDVAKHFIAGAFGETELLSGTEVDRNVLGGLETLRKECSLRGKRGEKCKTSPSVSAVKTAWDTRLTKQDEQNKIAESTAKKQNAPAPTANPPLSQEQKDLIAKWDQETKEIWAMVENGIKHLSGDKWQDRMREKFADFLVLRNYNNSPSPIENAKIRRDNAIALFRSFVKDGYAEYLPEDICSKTFTDKKPGFWLGGEGKKILTYNCRYNSTYSSIEYYREKGFFSPSDNSGRSGSDREAFGPSRMGSGARWENSGGPSSGDNDVGKGP